MGENSRRGERERRGNMFERERGRKGGGILRRKGAMFETEGGNV